MSKRTLFKILALSLVFSGVANGANAQLLVDKYSREITNREVKEATVHALERIHDVECEPKRHCDKATPTELEKPPLTMMQARAAMAHGGVAAMAEWCKMDWKRSFVPMMAFARDREKMDKRQLMLMTMIHTDFRQKQLMAFDKKGQCPAKLITRLDSELPKL